MRKGEICFKIIIQIILNLSTSTAFKSVVEAADSCNKAGISPGSNLAARTGKMATLQPMARKTCQTFSHCLIHHLTMHPRRTWLWAPVPDLVLGFEELWTRLRSVLLRKSHS